MHRPSHQATVHRCGLRYKHGRLFGLGAATRGSANREYEEARRCSRAPLLPPPLPLPHLPLPSIAYVAPMAGPAIPAAAIGPPFNYYAAWTAADNTSAPAGAACRTFSALLWCGCVLASHVICIHPPPGLPHNMACAMHAWTMPIVYATATPRHAQALLSLNSSGLTPRYEVHD
jgi:hypothetical protein